MKTPNARHRQFPAALRVNLMGIGLFALSCGTAISEPVRQVEITPDPPDNGQQVFTIRFTPGETKTYDLVTFTCVLRQEFASATTDRRTGNVVHEPESFVYRRKDLKMVDDLDCHVSFRVPVGLDRLKGIYGDTAFYTNAPVTVPRMTIAAFQKKQMIWSFEVPANGIHKPAITIATPPDPAPLSPTPSGSR